MESRLSNEDDENVDDDNDDRDDENDDDDGDGSDGDDADTVREESRRSRMKQLADTRRRQARSLTGTLPSAMMASITMVRERDKGVLRILYALKRATMKVSLGTDRFQSSMGVENGRDVGSGSWRSYFIYQYNHFIS